MAQLWQLWLMTRRMSIGASCAALLWYFQSWADFGALSGTPWGWGSAVWMVVVCWFLVLCIAFVQKKKVGLSYTDNTQRIQKARKATIDWPNLITHHKLYQIIMNYHPFSKMDIVVLLKTKHLVNGWWQVFVFHLFPHQFNGWWRSQLISVWGTWSASTLHDCWQVWVRQRFLKAAISGCYTLSVVAAWRHNQTAAHLWRCGYNFVF